MKAGQSESPVRYIRAHARVGIASSNSAYPSSDENLFSKVGMITSIERSTTRSGQRSSDTDMYERTVTNSMGTGRDVGDASQSRVRDPVRVGRWREVRLRVGSAPAPRAVLVMTSPHHPGAPLAYAGRSIWTCLRARYA